MGLAGRQVREIRQVMQSLLPEIDELRRFMFERLDRALDEISDGDLTTRCSAIVSRADAQGWLDDLFEALQEEFPESILLRDVVQKTGAHARPAASTRDPCAASYFRRRPFLDREPLRVGLRQLCSDDGARILVVDGAPSSGKSYSVHLIHHIAEGLRFHVVHIDLLAYIGREVTPVDLADAIAFQMKLEKPPRPEAEQLSRWGIWFCNWFIGQVRNQTDHWWIVFDSFQQISISAEALDLIRELSRHVDGTLGNVRLILLNYRDLLPHDVEPGVEREMIDTIEKKHVTDFFIQFFLENGKYDPDETADAVAEIVHRIFERTDRDDPNHLRILGSAVNEECRRILQESA